jgi:hypothetical protein
MKHLKITIRNFAIVLITALMSSCGGGNDIEAVKLIPVKMGKEYEYVNAEGKILINPQFSEATIFRNGLALVQTSSDKPQWGYIDEDGKFAITANYISATVFSEHLAWVVAENTAPTCIDTQGEIRFVLTNAEEVRNFSDGLAAFKDVNDAGEEKWGFVDKVGKVRINAQFSDVGSFMNGKCPVSNDEGKWGYIDKDGKLIINHQFDHAASFSNHLAVVKSNGKAGLIDANGKFIVNPQFSEMQNDGDLFLVKQDGKFGWTDKEGKIIINPQFTKAFPFTHGKLAAVESGKSYGFIDKEGKIVINPQFDYALPFNGKLALVVSSNKIGFINSDGKYEINPQFDNTSEDLVEYFQTGGSTYNAVKTDFFNVGAITSRINLDSPEGLTLNSTMSEVIKKFNKSESFFSRHADENVLISSEKITNDATLNFLVLGNPWQNNGYYDYYYGYSNYSFNMEFKPTGFAYEIELKNKGYGKEEVVKTAIENSLTGYTKDESLSSETIGVYNSSKQSVTIRINHINVLIVITPPLSIQNNVSSVKPAEPSDSSLSSY